MIKEITGSPTRRRFLKTLSVVAAGTALSLPEFVKDLAPSPMNHPICIFSKNLQWLGIPEMATAVAAMGYDGIDLTVRRGGHIAPERAAEALPTAVASIRKAGLEVPMIVTDITSATDPLTVSILKAASKLGIKYYRTGYLDFDPKKGVAASLEGHKKGLGELAVLNKKYGLHGAYQNHSGSRLGSSVWDLWEVLKDVDPRWMGVQYDIKHATAEGGYSWVNGLDLVKNHVRCLDIKDFHWEKTNNKWEQKLVPLGEGMVEYKLFFSLLKTHRISGPMSIHFEYPLGGAETGNKALSIPKEEVYAAMKRDLGTLRRLLSEA